MNINQRGDKDYEKNDAVIAESSTFDTNDEEESFEVEIEESSNVKDVESIGLYNNKQEIERFINGEDLCLTGINGEKEQGFMAYLKKKQIIRNIELQFYSKSNYATDFKVEILVDGQWMTLEDIRGFAPMYGSRYYSVNLEEAKNIEGIKVLATAYEGQQRLLLSGINLNSEAYAYPSINEVIQEIYSRYGNIELSCHQKCLLIMDWINKNIFTGITDTDPYITLKEKMGACGNKSSLMAAIAEGLGLNTRFINLYNYPRLGQGHSVVEIEWDGKWHLYDPFYCAYYVNNLNDVNNRVDPQVASFEELRMNPYIADTQAVIMNIGETLLATLEYEDGKRDKGGYYTSSGVYQYADPAGVVTADNPLNFPAVFDFEGKNQICIGYKNDSLMELSADPNNGIPMMMYFIGSTHCNVSHEYRLENLEQSVVYKLEIGILENSVEEFHLFVDGEKVEILTDKGLNITQEDKKIAIQFRTLSTEGKLFLKHNYTSGTEYICIDYIEIVKVGH